MSYKTTTLENGIRIITSEMPQMRSVATTVYVKAGSRYEKPEINGISHFLEHMLFKGTKKYPEPVLIAQAIEGVGGQLNAWTDQDHTAFYNILPSELATRGFEVLGEMLNNSLLDDEAIEREKGVIIEEINRRFDDPSSHVYEILVELMWPNQLLGQAVIGTKENILRIKQKDFRDYMGQFYHANSIVVSVAGNVNHEEVVKNFQKIFGHVSGQKLIAPVKPVEEQSEQKVTIYFKETDQAHLALGVRGLSYSDPDRYAWNLMNTILGQGMSSRLFLNIREDKGLAYHISSGVESYEDTGVLLVHAGLNIGKLEGAVEAICDEFKRMRDELVPEDELRRAKDFVKGMTALSMDDTDNVSSWYGRQVLLMPEILDQDEVIKKIESITAEDLQRVAKRVFQNKHLNLAIIAPLKDTAKFKELLKVD